jgi:hypothetical protein
VQGEVKRIVFVDGDMHVIAGVHDGDLPVVIHGPFEIQGRKIDFVSLVQVKQRYAVYKEPLVPMSYQSMHPAQK